MHTTTVGQVPVITTDPTVLPPGLWLDTTGARLVIEGAGSIYLRAYPVRDDEQRVVYLGVVYDEAGRDLDWPVFRSGAGDDVDPVKMMATALGFLAAAAESHPDGENAGLFAPECTEWAYQNSTEIECALTDIEEARETAEGRDRSW